MYYAMNIFGGIIAFEDNSHMSPDEYLDYCLEAHWDTDQGFDLEQGPTGPGLSNYLHWSQYTITSISTDIVDEWNQSITP